MACRVCRTGELPAPVHLFLSSARPPKSSATPSGATQQPASGPLSDDELIDLLKGWGGAASQVLQEPSLLKAFLPALRADFDILTQVRCDEPPLGFPVTLIRGADDANVRSEHLTRWRPLLALPAREQTLPGGHFYPQTQQSALLAIVNDTLGAYL